jgi:hypothetical protein
MPAPSGSCQPTRSPSTATPSATPTTGVGQVTVDAAVGPHARRVFWFQM